MDITKEVLAILEETLGLNGRSAAFSRETLLLGSLPELDSMAVVGVMTSLEGRFGFAIEDDEIDGATFASVGSLIDFVREKLRT